MVLLLLMITSVMCYCLQTHDSFRTDSDRLKMGWTNTSIYCNQQEIDNNPKIRRDCLTEPLTGVSESLFGM